MTKTPENTSERGHGAHLLGLMVEGNNNYITGMEADGQRQLVASDVLPIDCSGQEQEFAALGFEFGENTDNLFRAATLPEGWRRDASDHDMWSYIVDDAGTRRVAVFYKAAFYDRKAFMRIEAA